MASAQRFLDRTSRFMAVMLALFLVTFALLIMAALAGVDPEQPASRVGLLIVKGMALIVILAFWMRIGARVFIAAGRMPIRRLAKVAELHSKV